VTVVDKNRAVVCYLLATSAIRLSDKKKRKRKMRSKKWYLDKNASCNAHLLNGGVGFTLFQATKALRESRGISLLCF
jgi:hypothetical protein